MRSCFAVNIASSSVFSLLSGSLRCAIELRMPDGFRCETGEGHYQERERNHCGKHPEREYWKLLQAWEQVGIVHVKGRPQDYLRHDHADDMSTDPLFSQ